MKLSDIHIVYFVGIGGIGMSAIARFFNTRGVKVSGYDRTSTPLTDQLQAEGIEIHFNDDISQIPNKVDLVIYTPAIPDTHKGLSFLKESGITMMKRSQVLGVITENLNAFAVAGTHGKTTTSSMVAHILNETVGVNAFVGGIMSNYDSNFLGGSESKNVVVEADEFDRSFMTLFPNRAAITSIDADHLDIYGEADNLKKSFVDFAGQVQEDLVIRKGLDIEIKHNSVYSYAVEDSADYVAKNIVVENGKYKFDIGYENELEEGFSLGISGRHNVENATAAFALAHLGGVSPVEIKKALSSYNGVKRRFEYIVRTDNVTFIDDYAHHPEELKAAISSARELFPKLKITGVFQPHLFSRTRDFEAEFAEELSKLDELILLDIYPARELPIEGVTSEALLGKVKLEKKNLLTKEEVKQFVKNSSPEVLMTLGAGDIDQLVKPLKEILSKGE